MRKSRVFIPKSLSDRVFKIVVSHPGIFKSKHLLRWTYGFREMTSLWRIALQAIYFDMRGRSETYVIFWKCHHFPRDHGYKYHADFFGRFSTCEDRVKSTWRKLFIQCNGWEMEIKQNWFSLMHGGRNLAFNQVHNLWIPKPKISLHCYKNRCRLLLVSCSIGKCGEDI